MRRSGFTVIEILIVLIVMGILAAIAIPRYVEVRERGYIATMQYDLHGLRLVQEIHRRPPDRGYATTLAELGDDFALSPGVTITFTEATETFWAAEATHKGTSVVCRTDSDGSAIDCVAAGGKEEEEPAPGGGK